jgi:FkbM family methyltransferase
VLRLVCDHACFARSALKLADFGYALLRRGRHLTTLWCPVRIMVLLVSCNRDQGMLDVLGDLAREKRGWVDLRVYDDGSSHNLARPKHLTRRMGGRWTDLEGGPHGRKGYWRVWTTIMRDLPPTGPARLFCVLPDDVRLCRRFYPRLLEAWNSRPLDPEGRPLGCAVNILADRGREKIPGWGFWPPPERVNEVLWRTGWVDGIFLASGQLFDMAGRAIPRPSEAHWKIPDASSGVWKHVSGGARTVRSDVFRVHRSLLVHTAASSAMHSVLRRREPIVTAHFIDGEEEHMRLCGRDPIHASLASIPSRAHILPRTVESLLGQVDIVRVYLNGYDSVPECLRQERVVVARSQDHGDHGDAGKFFWCEEASGYELACDDDHLYPPGYVPSLLSAIERYGRKAAVGHHGCLIVPPVASYYKNRKVFHWNSDQSADVPVHVVATNALGYHACTVKLRRADFRLPNMADIWFALACEAQGVARIVMAHKKGAIGYVEPPSTIYDSLVRRDGPQTEAVRSVSWREPVLPPQVDPTASQASVVCATHEPIHASLASIPSRAHILPRTVGSLLGQVDLVRVYLNGYDSVPECLRQERIVVVRSQDHGNRGDAGKFFWCEEASGYELSCDDDIVYPKTHAAKLVGAIERYARTAAVSLHGTFLHEPIDYRRSGRKRLGWYEAQDEDEPCHVLGTGVLGYHCSTLKLCRSEFRLPNMADVWFALACELQGVARIVLAHKSDVIDYIAPPWALSSSMTRKKEEEWFARQTEILKSVVWRRPAFAWTDDEPEIPVWGWPTDVVDVELDGVKARFECDRGHIITRKMQASHSFYEADLLRAIRGLRCKGIYVDVGAHVGTHSVWFALACQSTQVISFEPDRRYFPLLSRNTLALGKVEVLEQALSEREERVRIGGYSGRARERLDIVQATTLDAVLRGRERVALIKVDVDGLDVPILRGARETIARCRPYIAVECPTEPGMKALRKLLGEINYEIAGTYCATPTHLLRPL